MSRRRIREDWKTWWAKLDREDRRRVRAWLLSHPPPPQWLEGPVAYAFTEMSFGPRG